MPDRPPEPRERLGHARERLGEAESLLEEGFLEPAVHAAYYAIFHGAMGALATEDSHPRTHRGTHTEFGRLMVRSGKVDAEAASLMQEVWDGRLEADYGVVSSWSTDEVEDMVEAAARFLAMVEPVIEGSGES